VSRSEGAEFSRVFDFLVRETATQRADPLRGCVRGAFGDVDTTRYAAIQRQCLLFFASGRNRHSSRSNESLPSLCSLPAADAASDVKVDNKLNTCPCFVVSRRCQQHFFGVLPHV
jgi:hypothetical protein